VERVYHGDGSPTRRRISQPQQAMRFCPPDMPDFNQLLEDADDKLFQKILNNPHHTLYHLLSPQSVASQNYTGRSPVGRRPTGVAHSKIARVARVVFVLYMLGRAS